MMGAIFIYEFVVVKKFPSCLHLSYVLYAYIRILFSSQCLVFLFIYFYFCCLCCCSLRFQCEKRNTYPATKGGRQIAKSLSRITNFLSKLSWIIVYLLLFHFISTIYNTSAPFHFIQSRFQMRNKQIQMENKIAIFVVYKDF